MNVRIRTERHGKVALTMGAVVLTLPADEARALARAILHHADEADPVRADRAFGEVLAPDVPAPRDPFPKIGSLGLADAQRHVAALLDEIGARTPIYAAANHVALHGRAAVDVSPGAINLVDIDR